MDVPTSTITFVETEHGRLRRRQRCISKKDLQKIHSLASQWRPISDLRAPGFVYIVNERTGEEVTSYAVPLQLDPVPETPALRQQHQHAQTQIRRNLACWTSHTVMVVDTSGSMKAADVWGTRTRLGAVWVSIALDFVAHRLEHGDAGATDVISIVSLGPASTVIVREAPCT